MKKLNDMSKDLRKSLEGRLDSIRTQLIQEGEDMCEHARGAGDYRDNTGTLRSSIAYRLYENGETISEGGDENVSGSKPQTEDPHELAISALEENPPTSADGFSLVLVAGAPYSKYVEDKGFNVMHLTIEEMKKDLETILSSQP